MFLNEATLLQNIKQRYGKDKIYVSFKQFKQTNLNKLFFLMLFLILDVRSKYINCSQSVQRN